MNAPEPPVPPPPVPTPGAPPAASSGSPAVPGAAAARGPTEPTFGQLMAAELQRAPWFLISIAVHALLFFLLLWLIPPVEVKPTQQRVLRLDPTEQVQDAPIVEPPPEEPVRPMERTEDPPLDMPLAAVDFAAPTEREQHERVTDFGAAFGSDLWGVHLGTSKKGGDILDTGNAALLAGGFKETVSTLRKEGLEIVFLFDSTGSMSHVLQATKDRIGRMVDVLHALVPGARIGIVTYRDASPSDGYLTRSVELTQDVYRVMNFMHEIEAGGGGDWPEAVYEALQAAFAQRWSKAARRVVVLIGDAPPHSETENKIRYLVGNFAHNNRSFVHTVVTVPDGSGNASSTTTEAFAKIAKQGKGESLQFEDATRIMKQVLDLAFGREFTRNLDEVYRLVDRQQSRVSPMALDAVRRGDVEEIERQLAKDPVPDDFVKAMIRLPHAKVLDHLVDMLQRGKAPAPARHAAAHVLHKVLRLRLPPIGAERGEPLPVDEARVLQQLIRDKLAPGFELEGEVGEGAEGASPPAAAGEERGRGRSRSRGAK